MSDATRGATNDAVSSTMGDIGIIGAGIAGLNLALYLQKQGVSCRLYVERTPEEVRSARLPNLATLFASSRARDRVLGTNHWDGQGGDCYSIDVRVKGLPELSSHGKLSEPAIAVDVRMVTARLLEDFISRGGEVIKGGVIDMRRLVALGREHSLIVVASGRGELGSLFPRILARCSWLEPQRRIFAGLFRGVSWPSSPGLCIHIIPGQGEIFANPVLGPQGPVTALMIEALTASVLEPVTRLSYEDNPFAFEALLLDLLRQNAPEIAERVDANAFEMTGPLDYVQCAIVPTARRGYLALGNSCFGLSIGDAFATHDPICSQGANAASRSAFLLGEMICARLAKGAPLDRAFCEEVDQALWSVVGPSMEWTSAFLSTPTPATMALFTAASRCPEVADAFATNFDDPSEQWRILGSTDAVIAFLAGRGGVACPCKRQGEKQQAC